MVGRVHDVLETADVSERTLEEVTFGDVPLGTRPVPEAELR